MVTDETEELLELRPPGVPGEKKDLSKQRPEILEMMIERAAVTRFPSVIFPNPGLDQLTGPQ